MRKVLIALFLALLGTVYAQVPIVVSNSARGECFYAIPKDGTTDTHAFDIAAELKGLCDIRWASVGNTPLKVNDMDMPCVFIRVNDVDYLSLMTTAYTKWSQWFVVGTDELRTKQALRSYGQEFLTIRLWTVQWAAGQELTNEQATIVTGFALLCKRITDLLPAY